LFILLFDFKCKLLIFCLQILAALEIVRQGADVMPKSQLNQVLDAELGPGWSSKLISFDYEPIAAASIGQVHSLYFFRGWVGSWYFTSEKVKKQANF